MKEERKKLYLAIVLVIITIIVIIISFTTTQSSDTKHNISILKQPSEFFTVNSCLYRTISYVSNKDTDSLLKVLNNSYKKKNKINANNVLKVFPSINGEATFVSKKMYYEKINNKIKKFYVKGIVKKNTIHDFSQVEKEENDYIYFIVTMDSKKQVFSIEPYDGEIFMDGDTNE